MNPALDTQGLFWTSTLTALYPNNAFRIHASEGHTAFGVISGKGPARCVREPAAALASAYEIHAGGTPTGTVVDTGTWLTWQQSVPPQTYTWAEANDYCNNNVAGLPGSGWRLPSMKELQTILDDTRKFPAIDPAAFPNTPFDLPYGSSSPVSWTPGYAWHVLFDLGQSWYTHVNTGALHVRCVR